MILGKIDLVLEQNDKVVEIIKKLKANTIATKEELQYLLDNISQTELEILENAAQEQRHKYYDKRVYMRGLIEISNYCTGGCLYCGINRDNNEVKRYRLDIDTILETLDKGYELGFKTFVLQGGEDTKITDEFIVEVIKKAKAKYDDIAITLSLGERSYNSYKLIKEAGADRYLLRHEAASKRLYNHLHQEDMSFENRMECIWNLKELGYQVGCGYMVNSPTQTNEDLVEDFLFIHKLQPDMCGIGPYLTHSETVFKDAKSGTMNQVRVCVAITRLLIPHALIPATTALATIDPNGREKILTYSGNVVMPNLTPQEYRESYQIYENKVATGLEAAETKQGIFDAIESFGLEVDMQIGHVNKQK